MIECSKIEIFVILEMFYPYMSDLLPMDQRFISYWEEEERIEKILWKEPEYIIELLEEYPETKNLVFERINHAGGVKFYRYLDMNYDVIQYVLSELKHQEVTADMVRQLREMTDAGMMDCKKALEKNNNDINKAAEYIRENEWKHRVMI